LTETTPVVHLLPLEDAIRKVGSIGRLIPTLEARLITEGGEDAEAGQPGELWIRGPTVMKGYLKNEESTKDTFQVPGDEGGEWNWFKTGDVAVVDEEGYFRIVDRVKELIK
jgi:4-coumarate--CoA ligase